MQKMVQERETRSRQALEHRTRRLQSTPKQLLPTASQNLPPRVSLSHAHAVKVSQRDQDDECEQDVKNLTIEDSPPAPLNSADDRAGRQKVAIRDAGVSEGVWEQLQKDAQAEQEREETYQTKLRAKREVMDDALREKIVRELIEEEERRATGLP